MLVVISGVQDSTAAEKVCRRHTLATVGSPGYIEVSHKEVERRQHRMRRREGMVSYESNHDQVKDSLRANMCSWIRVSWTFASLEFVTMRQLIIPSDMTSDKACRRYAWVCMGVPWTWLVSKQIADETSFKTAAQILWRGAGGLRIRSAAHRLISLSSCEAAFYKIHSVIVSVGVVDPKRETDFNRKVIDCGSPGSLYMQSISSF